MPASDIVVKGAREHNLRDVNLVLPRNQLICLTGVSGSGKSSFAFDTVFAEGQRRYVESLSSFARQFLGQMPKPDVDLISGLSPSISISQKSSGNNPRSTVGTITEIYDFLRVLYARVGQGFCPKCDQPIAAQTRDQIIGSILQLKKGTEFFVLAPVVRAQKGEHRDLFVELLKKGFVRARVDGEIRSLNTEINLDRSRRHHVEVVIDRLTMDSSIRSRLAEAVESGLKLGSGSLIISVVADDAPNFAPDEVAEDEAADDKPKRGRNKRKAGRVGKSATPATNDRVYSSHYACASCGISFSTPTPQMFSFNSPQGMCHGCDGLGEVYTFDRDLLVPDPGRSFQQGCIEILGKWKDLGRWRRHIYQGVADTIEREYSLEPGTMLETAWESLTNEQQEMWLFGTGDRHITYTWRGGSSPMKYGGTFGGIVAELEDKYRSTSGASRLRKYENYMAELDCVHCHGDRLNKQARHFRLETSNSEFTDHASLSLPEVCDLSIDRAHQFFSGLVLDKTRQFVAAEPLKEIRNRLGFLLNVGLDYLMLNRTAPTLSGGESQRIRLAGQIGAGLVGVLYILDEPSIGLHARDNDRLVATLQHLRDIGNTVVVVEHDEDTMRAADHLIDFGPGPGVRGGEVVVEGHPSEIIKSKKSVTAQFLSGRRKIEIPETRRPFDPQRVFRVKGARHNNLKDVDIEIPLGKFVCVTGVSGSGKSSLVNDIIKEELREKLNGGISDPGEYDELIGVELMDKMIAIDQSPIGRTPRSNPGTYIKLFDEIRKLFTQLPESKTRGYAPGRFSFNVKGGRCEACEGNGSNKLEMDFLADVWVTCPVCEGQRFNRETLQVKFRDKSISDVLNMDIEEAMQFFENQPRVLNKLQTLHAVGLDYLKIGQPSPTLSGGEAQRIKLARELVKRSTGKTLYLLDEPTTGLHFADISLLLNVLQNFVEAGNTVLVVEHNLDVIKTADWIIDIGPEGGAGGGQVVCCGTPEQVAECKTSYTGQALKRALSPKPVLIKKNAKSKQKPVEFKTIKVRGAEQHSLRSVDVDIERDKMTVFCGPSGSGKSSMAMDTIYAEGQRRYVESLSSYARQFVSQLEKPKVEHIEGLSPAIAIEQKNLGSTPRSTVGTVTEIYDYLRILLARLGTPYCPDCDLPIGTQTSDDIVDKILAYENGTRLLLLAPVEPDTNQSYEQLWEEIQGNGFIRVRIDNKTYGIDEVPVINRRTRHHVEIVVDRIVVKDSSRSRIADSVEAALAIGKGVINVAEPSETIPEEHWRTVKHSQHLSCSGCGRSFDTLTPHNFSFNSQLGWCQDCEGIGTQTGAHPAAIMNDNEFSLKQGAVLLWPDVKESMSMAMLKAWCHGTGVPIDTPFSQLEARHRRMVFYGTGRRWFDIKTDDDNVLYSFQYKGAYPTMEEASRLSPQLRQRMQTLIGEVECGCCGGSRLRDDASAVRFRDMTIDGICRLPIATLSKTLKKWKLDKREKKIAGELIREITGRVNFLNDVGLEYLTLNRTAASLSNGEAQRIRLASQLGSGLCGVLYVLDEPTIGLHPRDNTRLLKALHRLRDLGNTMIVVEHDKEVIANSDAICDFGPKAGVGGGQIVAEGTPQSLGKQKASVTGPYLSGKKAIPIPANRRPALSLDIPESSSKTNKKSTKKKTKKRSEKQKPAVPMANTLDVVGAKHNNLKNIEVKFPLETLTVVTGPSGCGKSSLINDILYKSLARRLHRSSQTPGAHRGIRGIEYINKVIRVDQTPLGNSPSSNPATYTGAFDAIRDLFAHLPDAKLRGFTARRFSFNVPGGRCEECLGNGQKCIEMHFLPDVWVECESCRGQRYNEETLNVRYNDRSIADVLNMPCGKAVQLFHNIPKIRRILQTLCDVGLDYITLGQSAPTLSGGEAQRVKLAAELSRPDTGRTLYLLDEPTTGLHFEDLQKLLEVLQRLVDVGNTVVLIEHNLDMIKAADWVVDLGPEAGANGGQIVVQGTPEMIVDYAKQAKAAASKTGKSKAGMPRSWTGEALIPVLANDPYEERPPYDPNEDQGWKKGDMDIEDIGANAKMPWEANGRRWHTEDRVGRGGQSVQWEGEILKRVVDTIQQHEGFGETDWNERARVEISGSTKSKGWFFHALTGDTWFLKMKFRVRPRTFKRETLVDQIPLLRANDLEDIPVYGNTPRVRVKNTTASWQEVEIVVNNLAEMDIPGFWSFLDTAIESFLDKMERKNLRIDGETPWAKLGKTWHMMRKGFPAGKPIAWEPEVLDELQKTIEAVAPEGEFHWTNKQVVHVYLPDQKSPWASIMTKKADGVWLQLAGPKDQVTVGQVADLASAAEIDTQSSGDVVKLSFQEVDQVNNDSLKQFLRQHSELVIA
ncbi:MAG: excinuclease ABC subunit UvrA [Planctomycetota bacterium]